MTENSDTAAATKAAPLTLKDDFAPPTLEEWRAVVERDLKGADFDKKLVWRTPEEIPVQPMYTRADLSDDAGSKLPQLDAQPGLAPFTRGAAALPDRDRTWQVRQTCSLSTPEEANAAMLDGLARGTTALCLKFDAAARRGLDGDDPAAAELTGREGCTITSINGLRIALQDVVLSAASLTLEAGEAALPALAMLAALADERGVKREELTGCVDLDPIGTLAAKGSCAYSAKTAHRLVTDAAGFCTANCPGVRPIMVDGTAYHEAGASSTQEAAAMLAAGAEYMRVLVDAGLSPKEAAKSIWFRVPVGVTYFMEVAKLRAIRGLWAKIVKAFGCDCECGQKMHLHVETSKFTKTVYDPYNNLLRTSVEAFAAAVGGCDSLNVGTFDETLGTPDVFSMRLARNQQTILREEVHLNKVADPAAGSYYVEHLTDAVGREAWRLFQETEGAGGLVMALSDGRIQAAIAGTAAKRDKLIAQRRAPVVGVSNYPNPMETLPTKPEGDRAAFIAKRSERVQRLKSHRDKNAVYSLIGKLEEAVVADGPDKKGIVDAAIAAVAAGATIAEVLGAVDRSDSGEKLGVDALPATRAAVPYENLRDNAAAYKAKNGQMPKVFLAPLGPVAWRRARAEFSLGFFGAGGFEVIDPGAFETNNTAIAAAIESNAQAVVLCSDDDSYPLLSKELIAPIKMALPGVQLIVAGAPGDNEAALREAGVDGFVHLRVNTLEFLQELQKTLGIR